MPAAFAMVKYKDSNGQDQIAKSDNKPDKLNKVMVFDQNPNDPDGSRPKFEFTKVGKKIDKKLVTVIGYV